MDIAKVALQSLLSVAVLFGLTRLTGKRSIHQMSAFDYINSITIGSIAAEMATDLESWERPLTAMLLYGLLTAAVNFSVCKSLRLRRFFNGTPLILYENDTILKNSLRKAKLDLNTFLAKCRLAGYFDLSQLECAVMETNGQISFLPKAARRPATPQDFSLTPPAELLPVCLILDGSVLQENLRALGKDSSWLQAQLHAEKIGQISDVFFACCDGKGKFYACRKKSGEPPRARFAP